ncbi:hypothetical protein [Tritonibacter mobilis]|uniref:hypothetical protein n=1 Tax=Tritonibacter mobilis TaxID=379347 RepID=UPI000806DFF8|nr:hypothetical protein [Tritonibacter mobilis]
MAYFYNNQEILTPYAINDMRIQFVNESLSLKREITTLAAQRFDLTFSVKPSHDGTAMAVAHMANFDNVETMVMPQAIGADEKLTLTGTATVKTAGSAGSNNVEIATSSGFGVIPAGYFIKFSNHSKIYLTTADVDLSDATNKSLNIYPRLLKSVPVNSTIQTGNDAIYTYKRDLIGRGVTFVGGVLSNPGSIKLIEEV